MQPISVPVVITENNLNYIPRYARQGDAGCDACARLAEPLTIYPNQRKLIPTGISVAIPDGYEIQVRPRSGSAWKQGLTVLNSPGTVDSQFRGEIGVLIINHDERPHTIQPGDRIAQLVLNKFETIKWVICEELPDSERGQGGFGSTGVSNG